MRWRPWRIPFRDQFLTGVDTYRSREGIIVEFRDKDGRTGIGEASPLPGYAGGSIGAVETALSAVAEKLVGLAPDEAVTAGLTPSTDRWSSAATRCGVESAVTDLGGRQRGIPASSWLTGLAGVAGPRACTSLAVNGIIDAGKADAAAAQASELILSGFGTLKLKVGGRPDDDIERIMAVRGAVGDHVELRIDANGGWDGRAARQVLDAAERYGVALCEQPLSPDAPEVLGKTAALRRETNIAVALDESCRSVEDIEAVTGAKAADAIVLKPMMTGLVEAARMLSAACAAGLDVIVTTSFDSSVGTAAAAQLSSLIPEPRMACGLATVPLLSGDLVEQPMEIENGCLQVGDEPGLGVRLSERALAEWATAPWSTR